METKDPVLEYFHACKSCEPVMCCFGFGGYDVCGCIGMPVDFKPTDKCGDDCELKALNESRGENGN